MTKKRFTDVWCSETGHIGFTDNGIDKELTGTEFEEFLNNLNDENEQLKQDVDYFNKTYEVQERGLDIVPSMCTISPPTSRRELFKENEQLKKENKKLKEDLEHCANQFTNDGKNILLSLR